MLFPCLYTHHAYVDSFIRVTPAGNTNSKVKLLEREYIVMYNPVIYHDLYTCLKH